MKRRNNKKDKMNSLHNKAILEGRVVRYPELNCVTRCISKEQAEQKVEEAKLEGIDAYILDPSLADTSSIID